MPTSITVAPGLIQSPRIICGRPIAATRISARRHSAARSRVREWATVTVQWAASSRAATGLPTMLERPITSARRPARSSPSVRRNRQHAGHRRARHEQARRRRAAGREQPADVERVEAVDVLRRIDRLEHARGVDLLRQRQLDQDAVHRRVGVERCDLREQVASADVGRQLEQPPSMPMSRPRSSPWCARRPGSPDGRRPGPRAGRAARPWRARNAAACARIAARSSAAAAAPSMICAAAHRRAPPGASSIAAISASRRCGAPCDVQDLAPGARAADQPERARRQPPALGEQRDQGRIRLAVSSAAPRPAPRGAPGRAHRPRCPAPRFAPPAASP